MKWMGGWTPQDYDDAPAALTNEVVRVMAEEYERIESYRRTGKHVAAIPSTAPTQKPLPFPTEIDSRTGYEMVTNVKEDGTVTKHRKIEDGEKILWAFVGKKPKSFEGKT